MLLQEKTNVISEEKCCKRYIIRFFCFDSGKLIFALLAKVITGHVVITSINIRQSCFEETLTKAFCSRRSSLYYYLNHILYVFIWINLWRGFWAYKSCYWYIRRPWRWSLSVGKLIWAFKGWQQPRWVGAGGFEDTSLGPTRASTSFSSYK